MDEEDEEAALSALQELSDEDSNDEEAKQNNGSDCRALFSEAPPPEEDSVLSMSLILSGGLFVYCTSTWKVHRSNPYSWFDIHDGLSFIAGTILL